jgi:hypothetical protein
MPNNPRASRSPSVRDRTLQRPLPHPLPAVLLELLSREERAQTLAEDRSAAVERRAEALLAEYLTDAEWKQLTTQGYLTVPSTAVPRRSYHIPRHGGRPLVYERGRPVCQLCVGPLESLPRADLVLLHLVMIRGDEAGYLTIANRLPV